MHGKKMGDHTKAKSGSWAVMKWFFLSVASMVGWTIATLAVPIQVSYRIFSKKYDLPYYFRQIAVGNDKMVGAMLYGSRHTVSAITGYRSYKGDRWHMMQERLIDMLFGRGHCYREAVDENLIMEEL